WNPDKSTGFCFAPAIREKTGKTIFFGEFQFYYPERMLYYYDYASDSWMPVANHPDKLGEYFAYNAKTGQITIKPALLAGKHNFYSTADAVLAPGVTYEWNIFGSWTGSNYDPGNGTSVSPPFFYGQWSAYSYSAGDWFYSYSYSYADSYEDGMDAVNGWFELVAGAAAE
ncbi:MAG TPA: hypothetical protein VIO60_10195, partial [Rectinemataceae bacterium]